jgi:hypothetical protein
LSDLTFSTAPKNGGKLGNRHKKFGGKPKNGIKKNLVEDKKMPIFAHKTRTNRELQKKDT